MKSSFSDLSVTKTSHTQIAHEYEWVTGGCCSECKEPFEGWHLASKTTCGTKCRKRRERRQKQQHSIYILIMRDLQEIRDGIKRRETLEDYREQLRDLKNAINDLLLLANDPDSVALRSMLEERARAAR